MNAVTDLELELDNIKAILARVPDPEVPAVTLEDLGIIRDVSVVDAQIRVTLTPTYMGCPATHAIRQMVVDALTEAGYPEPVLYEQLSPAWSTDWIGDEAKEKLRRYGIAPPNSNSGSTNGCSGKDTPKACPHCGSSDTELVSQFGSTACKSLYRCLTCKEPFEYFKCH